MSEDKRVTEKKEENEFTPPCQTDLGLDWAGLRLDPTGLDHLLLFYRHRAGQFGPSAHRSRIDRSWSGSVGVLANHGQAKQVGRNRAGSGMLAAGPCYPAHRNCRAAVQFRRIGRGTYYRDPSTGT